MKTQTLTEQIFTLLKDKRQKWTAEKLSNKLDVGIGKVKDAIEKLQDEGKNIFIYDSNIELAKEIPKGDALVIDQKYLKGKPSLFGFVTDNHLGSRYERLDVLNALYQIYQKAGVTVVYNAGNMIDGEARFNKHDLNVHGMDNQVDYLIKNYPQVKGMTTYFITGDK